MNKTLVILVSLSILALLVTACAPQSQIAAKPEATETFDQELTDFESDMQDLEGTDDLEGIEEDIDLEQ